MVFNLDSRIPRYYIYTRQLLFFLYYTKLSGAVNKYSRLVSLFPYSQNLGAASKYSKQASLFSYSQNLGAASRYNRQASLFFYSQNLGAATGTNNRLLESLIIYINQIYSIVLQNTALVAATALQRQRFILKNIYKFGIYRRKLSFSQFYLITAASFYILIFIIFNRI